MLTSMFSGGGYDSGGLFNDVRTIYRGGLLWGERQLNNLNGEETTTPSPWPSVQNRLEGYKV